MCKIKDQIIIEQETQEWEELIERQRVLLHPEEYNPDEHELLFNPNELADMGQSLRG